MKLSGSKRATAKILLVAGAAALATVGVAHAQLLRDGAAPRLPSLANVAVTPSARGPAASIREGVAAVVNNEIISTYDLRQRILLLIISAGVEPTQETLPQIQREALRDLVDEHLQMQEIRRVQKKQKVNVEPKDSEIDTEISGLAQQNGMQREQMVDALTRAGVDPETLRNQLRAEISWRRYVGGRFGGSVTVGSDQITALMKRVEAATSKPRYLVAEIFIDAQRAGGQTAAVEGAKQLIDQLQKGAPFAAVARQFSAAATGPGGGDAGWQGPDDLQPPLAAALEQMRPGQLSEPIAVNGGAYILLLRDRQAGSNTTLVSLKQAAIRLDAAADETQLTAARAKLESLRGQIKSCGDLEAETGKVEGVVAGDLGEADLNDLAPAFRDAVKTLEIGQVSAPVRTSAGLHLVALCARKAGGAQAANREDLENRLYEQELSMIARRELRNLRNSASIENR